MQDQEVIPILQTNDVEAYKIKVYSLHELKIINCSLIRRY